MKNLISGPILACLALIWTPNFFASILALLNLDIFASYHHMHFQVTHMIQAQENGKKNFILGLI